MRSNSDLNQMLQNAIKQIESLGITVGKIKPEVALTRATQTFGNCQKNEKDFTISLSKYFIDNDSHEVMETLLHEVLHTINGCMNHGAQWKAAASLVNEAFSYNITRLSSHEMVLLKDNTSAPHNKYAIVCESCGATEYRQRKCKIVTSPKTFSCPCGGKLVVVELY